MSDVIVVGGGLIGLLTARELAVAGAGVTLLERGELGREASWAAGGILSPIYPWRYPDAVNALSQWSQARFPELAAELVEETGVDPEWTRNGLLMLDQTLDDEALMWVRRWGGVVTEVDAAMLAELEPRLSAFERGAQWWPDIAQIRNPRLLRALAASLKRRGVSMHTGQAVTGFITEKGRVSGVYTAGGRFTAAAVVVASGAWSGGLLGTARDITPVRGQMLMFKAPPALLRHTVLAQGHYLVPRRDGRVLVGSTLEYVGFDKATTAEAYRALHGVALTSVPALADYPVERHWAGLRPGSRDGVPWIGEHLERPGVYVNAGHFRNGVVTGPASARLLADIVLKRAPIVDPVPYQWGAAR